MVTWAEICEDISDWVDKLDRNTWPVLLDEYTSLTAGTTFSDDIFRGIRVAHTALNEVAFYRFHLVEPEDTAAAGPIALNDTFHIVVRRCDDLYGKRIREQSGEIARIAWRVHGGSILEIQRSDGTIQVTYFTPQGQRLFFAETKSPAAAGSANIIGGWDHFHTNIIKTLLALDSGVIVVISAPEGDPPFVQFASRGAYEGEEDLNVAEISLMSPTGEPFPLTKSQLDTLARFRLHPLDPHRQYCVERSPMSGGFAKNAADVWVYLLRDIAGIASPAELVYSAWQYPLIRSQRGGTQFSQGDPVTIDEGGADIELPCLGLRRISNGQARNAQS